MYIYFPSAKFMFFFHNFLFTSKVLHFYYHNTTLISFLRYKDHTYIIVLHSQILKKSSTYAFLGLCNFKTFITILFFFLCFSSLLYICSILLHRHFFLFPSVAFFFEFLPSMLHFLPIQFHLNTTVLFRLLTLHYFS